ncbi:Peroxisome biogenesis protein 16 [Platanthera zijinensis]|uniref:Peroxisome biogenesis protein 16 n=1 Tax=Platanthera zijinensis TaxID=2320716 RepID=A0AAP0G5N5_9ASPA
MEAYKLWGMTWLLPERFSNNEIGLEADLETIVEVAVEHFYGKEVKWNFLIIMEFLK